MICMAHERYDCTSDGFAPPGVCFVALAAIAPILTVVSTALSVVGQISQANQAKKSADFEAAQLQEQASEATAASSRRAASDIRMGGLAQSRAQAVAAASGGSATDPTAVNIEQNISGQSEYNALTDLWSGSAEAAGLKTRANAVTASGENAQQAGYFGAFTTALSGAGSMFAKYGSMGSGGGVSPTSFGADINPAGGLSGGGFAGGYG